MGTYFKYEYEIHIPRSPDLPPASKARFHLFMRTRQVQHAVNMQLIRTRLPYVILASVGLMITPIYTVIRLYSVFHPMIIGAILTVGVLMHIMEKPAMELSSRVTEVSVKYSDSLRYSRVWERNSED